MKACVEHLKISNPQTTDRLALKHNRPRNKTLGAITNILTHLEEAMVTLVDGFDCTF
jgi:hypothetical protein